MKVLLHVDDSRHWHAAVNVVRPLVTRAPDGELVAFSTQWSRVKRARAFEDARRVADLPPHAFAERARTGLAEYVIPDEAREGAYDLVAVSRFGALDRVTSGLIGHLVTKVTPTNALLVRGRPRRVRRVLVAVTGAPAARGIARVGATLARAHDARLTLVHVLSEFGMTNASEAAVDLLATDFLRSGTPPAKELLAARDVVARSGVPVTVRVRAGLVVDEILDEVREHAHDVLVIGAHGMDVRDRFLTEDVAGHVVRHAPVSTLVVKHPGAAWAPRHPGP